VRVHDREWAGAQRSWPEAWRQQLAMLQAFAAGLPATKRGTQQAFQLREAKRRGGGAVQGGAAAQQQEGGHGS
jgi:hypothetical protein